MSFQDVGRRRLRPCRMTFRLNTGPDMRILLLVMSLLVMTGSGYARPMLNEEYDETPVWPEVLSEKECVQMALEIVPGQVVDIERDLQRGQQAFYEIDIRQEDNSVIEVKVSAHEKKIRDIEVVRVGPNVHTPKPSVSKEEVRKIVLDYIEEHANSGRIKNKPYERRLELSIERKDELVYLVDYKVGFDEYKMEISAYTGEIIKLKVK